MRLRCPAAIEESEELSENDDSPPPAKAGGGLSYLIITVPEYKITFWSTAHTLYYGRHPGIDA